MGEDKLDKKKADDRRISSGEIMDRRVSLATMFIAKEKWKKLASAKPEVNVEYNQETKSWRNPVTKAVTMSRFLQRRQDSELSLKSYVAQVRKEVKEKSLIRRKISQESSASCEAILEADDDNASVASISSNPIEELPIIHSPFAGELSEIARHNRIGKWKAPPMLAAEREKQFLWERPWGTGEVVVQDTPTQRARRAEIAAAEKERDLDTLRFHYQKAQRENYALVEEIRSFKGDHYDELKAENAKLKECYQRVFRENLMLRGQIKRMNNLKIYELEEKKKLEDKYGVRSRKVSSIS